jgi:hypothetical protein
MESEKETGREMRRMMEMVKEIEIGREMKKLKEEPRGLYIGKYRPLEEPPPP